MIGGISHKPLAKRQKAAHFSGGAGGGLAMSGVVWCCPQAGQGATAPRPADLFRTLILGGQSGAYASGSPASFRPLHRVGSVPSDVSSQGMCRLLILPCTCVLGSIRALTEERKIWGLSCETPVFLPRWRYVLDWPRAAIPWANRSVSARARARLPRSPLTATRWRARSLAARPTRFTASKIRANAKADPDVGAVYPRLNTVPFLPCRLARQGTRNMQNTMSGMTAGCGVLRFQHPKTKDDKCSTRS